MATIKVKAHKRDDGTKVKSHKRKVSRLAKAKASHSKLKGMLRKAGREGASKETIAGLKRMVYDVRGRVGEERNSRTDRRMSAKHKKRSYAKGEKGRHLARTKF